MGWGLWTGSKLANAIWKNADYAKSARLGSLGELVFLGTAYALSEKLELSIGDLWVGNLAGLSSALLTAGILNFMPPT